MSTLPTDHIHGYVIGYSAETYANVQAPFSPLDNRDNPRPDWQEYWPIRRFLLENTLEENHYYGFFSPRFSEKIGLTPTQIVEHIAGLPTDTDVCLFCPQPDMGAFFLNVFDQNELFDPGFKASAQSFCNFAELGVDLSQVVMDARNTVFSNYFFAKPAFWRRWLSVCEVLFNACENLPHIAQLHGWLHTTTYRDGIQRKVFLLERLASLLLVIEKHWRVKAHNPFFFAYSASRLNQFPDKAIMADALKMAYAETHNALYLQQFSKVIESIKT